MAFGGPLLPPTVARADAPSDYASETVEMAIKTLKEASGSIDATFQAYEKVAGIITEGEGVGGMVNYRESSVEESAPRHH